jgi:hypothetical protein
MTSHAPGNGELFTPRLRLSIDVVQAPCILVHWHARQTDLDDRPAETLARRRKAVIDGIAAQQLNE